MKRDYIRLILTTFITLIYCYIWMCLEKVICGAVTDRPVDNMMMLLFMPIIYLATDVLVK